MALLPMATNDNLEDILSATGSELKLIAEGARRTDVEPVGAATAHPNVPFAVTPADRRSLAAFMDDSVRPFLNDQHEGRYRIDMVWPDFLSKYFFAS